jgi:formylglycine-generating enzyme required for sulfatase activity
MGGPYTLFGTPLRWGATIDPTYTGPGERWRLSSRPHAADLPVGGISWRTAAMYANWLHNDKSPTVAALQTGAYDTSTWGWDPVRDHYFDGDTHLPGARFWIPTLDELMKASHYDPDRHGPGQGGWWSYKSMSDAPAVPGLPGLGETSANELSYGPLGTGGGIPVGSYVGYESPWGLMDTSGGGNEWTEAWSTPEFWPPGLHSSRLLLGASISDPHTFLYDHVGQSSPTRPDAKPSWGSLRIASAIPTPAGFLILVPTVVCLSRRNR